MYDFTYMRYLLKFNRDIKQNSGCQGLEEGRERGLLFNRYGVSHSEEEKVQEMDSGNGCTR